MSAPDSPDILRFWFGDGLDDLDIIKTKSELWWKKDESTDSEIRQSFEGTYQKTVRGEVKDWEQSPTSRLALIILLDQFSRNMYRDTPQAFASDPLALELTLEGIALEMDQELRPIERAFFYMPMEHSEDLSIQQQSVAAFQTLVDQVDSELKESMTGNLDFAIKHLEIIERFGRFPHRNKILNRQSTDEEIAFLKEPGSSF